MASASAGKQILGSHFESARILLPSVGANGKSSMARISFCLIHYNFFSIYFKLSVEAGKHNTGVGIKASLLEAKGAIGTNVGLQVGVNLNTEVGIGSDGTTAKVLGTGISFISI